MADDLPPWLKGALESGWRQVHTRMQDIITTELTARLGKMLRGDGFNSAFLVGRIPFNVLPANHDTILLSIPINSDSATQSITFDNPYPGTTLSAVGVSGTSTLTVVSTAGLSARQVLFLTTEKVRISSINQATKVVTLTAPLSFGHSNGESVTVLPDVTLGSGDIGWIPSWSSLDNTGFDLTLARRVSLTNSESGSYSVHFAIGDTSHDQVINFPVAYQGTPVIVPQSDDPAFAVTLVPGTLTNATVTLRVTHINTSASGLISTENTGIKPSGAPSEQTDSVTGVSTGGPSANITSDPLTRTDATWGAEDASTSTDNPGNTNNTAIGHTHSVPSGTDAGGGTTGTGGPTHAHGMPDHHHEHHHAHDLSAHEHAIPDHAHLLDDPGHNHTFAGDSTAVTVASDHTIVWMAFGTRMAGALTKEASWTAVSA